VKSKRILSIIIIALTISRCTVNTSQTETASPTPLTLAPGASTGVLTATSQPTLTPRPTETPLPPAPTPTITPVEGISSTQLNVRAEPSTASAVLGIIPPNTKVEIIGKDPGGSWWQILYPAGTQEKGWVTAQYVTTGSTPEVPVIGGEKANPNDGNVAIVQQQLNIRSGPGAGFNSVGTLNPQDVARLMGKDANGAWLQIEFTSGPDGKGWISAALVQAQGVESLPIITESGAIIGTGTPVDTPQPPTPTLVPAPIDGDSAESPAISISLSATGSRSFQYSSDVSSPDGDNEDWVQFTSFTQTTLLSLDCFGNGIPSLEVLQNNNSVQEATCGEKVVVNTAPASIYLVHIESNSGGGLQYARYILQIVSIP
jgi:uncharacterized protein YraI